MTTTAHGDPPERAAAPDRSVRVELLYFDGCPNHEALVPRLEQLLEAAGVPAQLILRRVSSDDAAHRERFLGSPTVRVQGRDVEPGTEARKDFGLKCRLYRLASGLSGRPLDEWVLQALRRTSHERPGI
jgi:hypothetical protein